MLLFLLPAGQQSLARRRQTVWALIRYAPTPTFQLLDEL